MPAVNTIPIELGFNAPNFKLFDTVSQTYKTFDDLKGQVATVVMFICNHCPFVVYIENQLTQLALDYMSQGVGFVAISSNDIEQYPQDAPQKMTEKALQAGYPFAYLFDETQAVARAYNAACTPDFSIFDAQNKCVYRGQLDDSRPTNNIAPTGNDIRLALNALLKNEPVNPIQLPSIGCSIKWKK